MRTIVVCVFCVTALAGCRTRLFEDEAPHGDGFIALDGASKLCGSDCRWKLPLSGGAGASPVGGPQVQPGAIALDAQHVYWTRQVSVGDFSYEIVVAPR